MLYFPIHILFNVLQDKNDIGRIIVFKNNPRNHWFDNQIEVSPKELAKGSRFGFSNANIGDIHKDDFQDFAVGAPMGGEDGKGVVFIFHGCTDFKFGKNKNCLLFTTVSK